MVLAVGSNDLIVTKAEQLAASARAAPRAITTAQASNEIPIRMILLLVQGTGGGVGTLPETDPKVDAEKSPEIQWDGRARPARLAEREGFEPSRRVSA